MAQFARVAKTLLLFPVLMLVSIASFAAPTITLSTSVASPQYLGTPVTWTVNLANASVGHTYDYRFRVWTPQTGIRILRDYNTSTSVTFNNIATEGWYAIGVDVRDTTAAPFVSFPEVAQAFLLVPRLLPTASEAVVNSTQHPLVALFSAPACTAGDFVRVRFAKSGTTTYSYTDFKPCQATTTNFFVAGMLPSTQYMMNREQYVSSTKTLTEGAQLPFTTGAIPSTVVLPSFSVLTPAPAEDQAYPVILQSTLAQAKPYPILATDLSGNVIWYSAVPITLFGHSEYGGNILGVYGGGIDRHLQYLREIDLDGDITQETNASIMNEQLAAMATANNQRVPVISGFHHEARRLPNGNILCMGQEDMVSTTAQGGTSTAPVDILGDVVMVLDSNMQLLWYWDSFVHEDITRMSTLKDTCSGPPTCLPFASGFTAAQDWLHSNSAQLTGDGNILLSERNQDWIIKIAYQNGTGDGHIIWRLGNQGDFTLLNPITTSCTVPGDDQWFSHQHDPEFQFGDQLVNGAQFMTIFDDGNTRQIMCSATAHSRGAVLMMDETDRVVSLFLMDLGAYSPALGSAQPMIYPSGTFFSFGNGFISGSSQTIEVDPLGNVRFNLMANALTYRSYRMTDLYNPPNP